MATLSSSSQVVEGGIEGLLKSLQPIRDLAKNWDIDIAACLDEYLGELELSQETRDTITTTNFAEAALVLQNSSNVYSRKVDYLHKFAHTLQEEIALENKKKKTTRKAGAVVDQEMEEFWNFDPNLDFLPLDDVLPTGDGAVNKINRNRTDNDNLSSTISPHSSASKRLLWSSSSKRLSSASTTTRLDRSDHAVNLRSTLNSMSTLRLTNGSCDINEEGVLWMPGAQQPPSSSQSIAAAPLLPTDQDGTPADRDSFGNHDDMDVGGYDDDDDNGGTDFVMNDDDSDPMEEQQAGESASQKKKRVTFAVGDIAADDEDDDPLPEPWEMLDRDVPNSTKPRPLRIGKTIVLPPGVLDLPSHGVTGASTRSSSSRRVTKRPTPPPDKIITTIPLHGLAYGDEFLYIQREFARRKQLERRLEKKQQRGQRVQETTGDPIGHNNDYDFGGDDDFDDDDEDNGNFDGFGNDDDGPSGSNTDTWDEALARNHEADADEEVQTFEELCRAHLRRFAQGAKKYAVETDLSQRVSQWQERLAPILEEEEKRAEFDIYEYGNVVLKDMEQHIRRQSLDDKNIVHFRDIAKDRERYEVCRIFLATLTLNNSGNIRYRDHLDLELLQSNVHRPMENYVAPSLL